MNALFKPLTIGGLEIDGRLIKTATSETRAEADGRAGDALIDFYGPLAEGGTPLIITGNIYVSADGKSSPRQMGVDSDDKIPGLRRLVTAVHEKGGRIFAQISHCGRQVVPRSIGSREALAPSAVMELSTGTKPRALTETEIDRIVGDFASAAGRCREAGFDGVQIHAAHGYLIGQFLTPHTNRRKDRYGGGTEGRMLFLREVFRAVRESVGPDYPVILKLNGADRIPFRAGLKTPEIVEIAVAMEAAGADAVEVSVGMYEAGFPMVRGRFWRCLRAMARGSGGALPLPWRWGLRFGWPGLAVFSNLMWPPREGFNLAYGRQFKERLTIPVIVVGGFLDGEAMAAAIARGDCDAVSAGRAFIADPYLHRHLRTGAAGPRCVFCNACVGSVATEPLDCFHPTVRAEKDRMFGRS